MSVTYNEVAEGGEGVGGWVTAAGRHRHLSCVFSSLQKTATMV